MDRRCYMRARRCTFRAEQPYPQPTWEQAAACCRLAWRSRVSKPLPAALLLCSLPPLPTQPLPSCPSVPQRNVGNLATHKDMNIMACIEYAVQGEQLIGWLSCALYRGRSLHMRCSMHPVCGAG